MTSNDGVGVGEEVAVKIVEEEASVQDGKGGSAKCETI